MKSILPYIVFGLLVAQLLLMPLSWLYSAAFPSAGVHSLLSGEGLRWFFGHFADIISTPFLVWIILFAMAYGAFVGSGAGSLLTNRLRAQSYRERRALALSATFLVVYIALMLLFTITPQAVLLSASGTLWPSPFSHSLVPVVAFGITVFSGIYGLIAGRFLTPADVCDSLLQGIRQFAPMLLVYVLLAQFYYSLRFVLP